MQLESADQVYPLEQAKNGSGAYCELNDMHAAQ